MALRLPGQSMARVTWYLYLRNLRVWIRQPAVVIPGFAVNIFIFLVFGSTFSDVIRIPGFPTNDYTAFITAMVLIQAIVFTSGDAGFALLTDMVSGYLDKLLLAPINRFAILMGSLLMAATRMVVSVVLIILVSFALGVSFKTGLPGVLVAILLATTFGVAWSCIGIIICLKTRNAQAAQASFVLFFPAIFLTTSFMPRELLPDWFKIAVTINPVNYVLEAIRVLVIQGWIWSIILKGVAVLLAVTVGLMVATTWLYRRVTS